MSKNDENLVKIPRKFFQGKLALFHHHYPEVQHRFMLGKLKKSIAAGENMCKLFRMKGTNVIIIVPKEQYRLTLEQILSTFIDTEEYELAQECKEVMNQYEIDELIRDSQSEDAGK